MNTVDKPLNILAIEDNPGDYLLLKKYLQLSRLSVSNIVHAEKMMDAATLVKDNHFDIAMLDLTLPDSTGIDSVITLDRLLPQTPIVVFSGLSAIEIAMQAISLGAQDYLIKGEFDEKLLGKAIQYSIERKKTLQKLQASNERYEFVNKATLDTIWEWNFNTNTGQWGDGFIKTFGYSKDNLLYTEDWTQKYIHPNDLERVTKNIKDHLETNRENWQDEYRFRCSDDSFKYVYDRGFILFDTNGKPYRMIGAMTDITERKKAEEVLRESENRFRTLFENMIEGCAYCKMIYKDNKPQDFIYLTVNSAFEKQTGLKDVVGKKVTEVIPGIKESSPKLFEIYGRVALTGDPERFEIYIAELDMWFYVSVYSPQKEYFVAVFDVITARKKAEKEILDAEIRYRTLFEQSPDGISVIDTETLLPIDFNEKIHTQLGYSREEFARLKISDYEMIDIPEVIKARAEKIMHEEKDNFETKHKTKNGDIRDVQVTILRITLYGKPVFYTIFRDITEKRKLEEKLKQEEINHQRQITEATIEAQEKERNELGRELHDNINQILATVKMYLGMAIAKENIPADLVGESYEYVKEAMEEIRKLSHSLVVPTLGDIDLPEALQELMMEINNTNRLQVQLINEMNKERVINDKKVLMLYRIVQEQMNNIYKHAQAKTVVIHLKEKDNDLHLSIADDGVGFDPGQKAKGIGLKNIQNRVELYSGDLKIISAPGKGCKLEIIIPFKKD